MLPMESDYVRFPSSASIWAADLHRRICEWEVRGCDAAVLENVAITMNSLSGPDSYDTLDATRLYHDHDYRALPPALQIPPEGYAHADYGYALHSSGVTSSGKLIAPSASVRTAQFYHQHYLLPCPFHSTF